MTPAEQVLSALDRVKSNGSNKWMACCPAHNDRSPSLSITEADGGKVLLHCFAGCDTRDVVSAMGLKMADLYPEGLSLEAKLGHERKRLEAARESAKLVLAIAQANAENLDDEDLYVAGKAKQALPDIEAKLAKLDAQTDTPVFKWPDPVDVFAEQVVPAFPLDCLPNQISAWATEHAQQSGFDPGAYAFAALGVLCNSIDHRAKLQISQGWRQPAVMWLGLFDPSGGGKSAVKSAATHRADQIDYAKASASQRALARYIEKVKEKAKEGEDPPRKPPYKQRIVIDTTVEALANLLADNPEGVNMFYDEITEFIGRMDAYSGGNGGKDRGVYLRSYDGGHLSIHRAGKPMPMQVDNFSVGILAGMQPEKLAKLFKQNGSQSDGLYQRFLIYAFRPSGDASFTASMGDFTMANFDRLFDTIEEWNNSGDLTRFQTTMDDDAQSHLESYTNQMRAVAKRTPAVRLREHLNRYPGFAARLTFGLHVVECAAAGDRYVYKVSRATLERSLKIMSVLYRHSEAAYELLDSTQGDVLRLIRSACEAALSKPFKTFKRGDLTRNATYWQGADAGQAEAAIDFLIELGWIADITPEPVRGKRGRKSDGLFMVNPEVFERYKDHTSRIKHERAQRYAAIKEVAIGIS